MAKAIDFSAPVTIGIVGAGAMGGGIAQLALLAGLRVVLYGRDPGRLEKARDLVLSRLDRLVEKGEAEAAAIAAAKEALGLATHLRDLAGCDIVIESIVEDLAVKRQLFRELEPILGDEAIIASNTSSLQIAAIAQDCRVRRRIAGMHFFNPAPLMRLVEVIRANDTDAATAEALMALARRMGRSPVFVKDQPGFLVNLGGRAYITEALHILQESVASAEEIDLVMRECCGFRMGPFELIDLIGLDVNFPVTRMIHAGYFFDPRLATTPLHETLFHAGLLGRKTGAGFYRYDTQGKRLAAPAERPASAAPPSRLVIPDADERLLALFGNVVPVLDADDGESPILLAPIGEDCTSIAVRLALDPRRTVAIDVAHASPRRVTIMAPPGGDPAALAAVAALLEAGGRAVTRIQDSPGFIAQRITAMIANLGCEMAQMGLASPPDIDLAMRLGLNYPSGPFTLADAMGVATTHDILQQLQKITGSDRYRPSLWLRRRALLGQPAAAAA